MSLNTKLPDDLKELISRKRLIFTVTPGRSGTLYLALLFSRIPGVANHHEAPPSFTHLMRYVQARPDIASHFWIHEKLPRIAALPEPIYAETSHLFCKGFAGPLLDLGIVPDLVVLTRSHRSVAKSNYRLSCIPARTDYGLKHLLSPDDPDVLPLPGWERFTDYQLCYWYCLEIERRSSQYARQFAGKGATVVTIALDELRTVEGFQRLIGELALPQPTPAQWAIYYLTRNRKQNQKAEEKAHAARTVPPEDVLDHQEAELLSALGPDWAGAR
jgi:hypothetical protein